VYTWLDFKPACINCFIFKKASYHSFLLVILLEVVWLDSSFLELYTKNSFYCKMVLTFKPSDSKRMHKCIFYYFYPIRNILVIFNRSSPLFITSRLCPSDLSKPALFKHVHSTRLKSSKHVKMSANIFFPHRIFSRHKLL